MGCRPYIFALGVRSMKKFLLSRLSLSLLSFVFLLVSVFSCSAADKTPLYEVVYGAGEGENLFEKAQSFIGKAPPASAVEVVPADGDDLAIWTVVSPVKREDIDMANSAFWFFRVSEGKVVWSQYVGFTTPENQAALSSEFTALVATKADPGSFASFINLSSASKKRSEGLSDYYLFQSTPGGDGNPYAFTFGVGENLPNGLFFLFAEWFAALRESYE
jgi:hypothetical protein